MLVTRTGRAAESSTWPGKHTSVSRGNHRQVTKFIHHPLAQNHFIRDYFPVIQCLTQTNGFSWNFTPAKHIKPRSCSNSNATEGNVISTSQGNRTSHSSRAFGCLSSAKSMFDLSQSLSYFSHLVRNALLPKVSNPHTHTHTHCSFALA